MLRCEKPNFCFLCIIILVFILFVVNYESKSETERKLVDIKSDEIRTADSNSFINEPIDSEKMTDKDWLLLFTKFKLGITYKETQRLVPNIGGITTEGAGSFNPKYGLQEAYYDLVIFDQKAKIEFNYKNDTLYNYGFRLFGLDSITVEKLYIRLKLFYTNLFGESEEYQETFEFFQQVSRWSIDTEGRHLHLVKNIYSKEKAYVGWGI